MTQLSHSLDVFSDGSLVESQTEIPPVGTLPAGKIFFRVLHEVELGGSRRSMPEVFPLFDNHFTPLTLDLQFLWKAINPGMTKAKWRALLGYQRAFTNNQGFGMSGDPRADFVNGLDLGAPLPKQEALVCGGALLSMKALDEEWLYPEYIDGHNGAPRAEWVMSRPWLRFTAVNIRSSGQPGLFPPGMENAQVLLLAYKPIRISRSKVVRWRESVPPDPYRVYL